MVEISEIVDIDSLKAWVKDQPLEVAVAIAARTALRGIPLLWQWALSDLVSKHGATPLACLRCALVASVGARRPTGDLRVAAGSAAYAAEVDLDVSRKQKLDPPAAANAACAAAYTIVDSMDAAKESDPKNLVSTVHASVARTVSRLEAIEGEDLWSAIRGDCEALSKGGDVWGLPLWPEQNPLNQIWLDLRPRIIGLPGEWYFWVDWYDQMLSPGENAPDWDFLEQVALIEPNVWDAEPEAVNAAIEAVRKALAQERARHFIDPEILEKRSRELQTQLLSLRDEVSSLEARLPVLSRENEALHQRLSAMSKEMNAQEASFKDAFRDLKENYKSKFETALASFVEDQKIKAPVELWAAKECEHTRRSEAAWMRYLIYLFVVAALIVSIVLVLCYGNEALEQVLTPVGCDPMTRPELCNGFSFRGMIVSGSALTLLTLALWIARLQMKVFISERHLALDARERRAFAQAYIGLINEGDSVTKDAKDQRALVYAALFRPSSDGMIKEENGMDPSLTAALSKLLSK